MTKPHGIIVFGANGSGKTTLGAELARILDFKHMDIEEYYFAPSEIPHTVARPREDCLRLMLADIEQHRGFVVTSCTGDFGGIIRQYYEFAVYMSAPLALRMERIKQRAYNQYGDRVLKGGDMYEQEQDFFNWAATRSLSKIELWAQTLTCPVVHIDGMADWHKNAANIAKQYLEWRENPQLLHREHNYLL